MQRKKGLKMLDGYVHRYASQCSKHCLMECDVVNQTVGLCKARDDSLVDSTLCDYICPNLPVVGLTAQTVE
jgi:hypothetical protein